MAEPRASVAEAPVRRFELWSTLEPSRRALFFAAVAFVVSRGCYWALGVRFDAGGLFHYWQYIDAELLKTDLVRSLYYLHSQPPLFNLCLGIAIKIFGSHLETGVWLTFMSLGLSLYYVLICLLTFVTRSGRLSTLLATVFMTSPVVILYENWLFYSYPVAVMLTVSVYFLARHLQSGRPMYLHGFFWMTATLCLTRSSYHLVFILSSLFGLSILLKDRRRAIVRAAAVPVLLVSLVFAKNWYVFGQFSSSSWFGMNWWGMVARDLPEESKQSLVMTGKLSPLVLKDRFAPIASYGEEYRQIPTPLPAVVAAEFKSNGVANYNHFGYIKASEQLAADTAYVILNSPSVYLIGVAKALYTFFLPADHYFALERNRSKVPKPILSAYEVALFGLLPIDLTNVPSLPLHNSDPRPVYLWLIIGLPLVTINALAVCWRRRRTRSPSTALLTYILWCVLYLALIGNLFEVAENNRFRFEADPLYLVLTALLLAGWARAASGTVQSLPSRLALRRSVRTGG